MRVVIIGGGPGGYVAALHAAKSGAEVTLVEKANLGGVCLNEGCIPTKSLNKHAAVLRDLRRAGSFGIRVDGYRLDMPQMIRRKDEVVSTLRSGVAGLLKRNGVRVVAGTAEIRDAHTVAVGSDLYPCDAMIIATGSAPARPPIPGVEHTVTSTELLSRTELPASMVVIGGGVIGVEFAGIYNQFGCKVEVVEMLDRIMANLDAEISSTLTKALVRDGVGIHTGTRVSEIRKLADGRMTVMTDRGDYTAACVLMATGRKPVLPASRIPIETRRDGAAVVDAHLRTNHPSVYCIGDANGKLQLAHVASAEALVAVDNIMGADCAMSYDNIPTVVYTLPEAASVGLTEQEAGDCRVSRFRYAGNGKALAMAEPEGFVKVLAGRAYDEIVGVHIVGADAATMIAEAGLAIRLEATVSEVGSTIHAHPSLPEMFMEACETAAGRPIHQ